jgi:phage gp36-like protein
MPYCTPTDVSNRVSLEWLSQLVPDGAGGVDTSRVQSAIADADGQIDMYARAVYETPFNPVSPGVRDLSTTLAALKLFAGQNIVDMSPAWSDAARTAKATLEGLRDGIVKPDGAVIKPFTGGSSGGYVQEGSREYARDGRGGF